MATSPLITIYVTYFLFGCHNGQPSSNGLLDLLSDLYKKSSDSKQPVVFVISKDLLSRTTKAPPLETKDDDFYSVLHLAFDKHQLKKRRPSPSIHKIKSIFEAQPSKLHLYQDTLREDKNLHRSPIIQNLLRISNSIKCKAQDQCLEGCGNKFSGPKKDKCKIICEIEYECTPGGNVPEKGKQQPEDYVDPCQSSSNDCDTGEKDGMSTKGVTITDERYDGCKRC